jgi:hypothetical protein
VLTRTRESSKNTRQSSPTHAAVDAGIAKQRNLAGFENILSRAVGWHPSDASDSRIQLPDTRHAPTKLVVPARMSRSPLRSPPSSHMAPHPTNWTKLGHVRGLGAPLYSGRRAKPAEQLCEDVKNNAPAATRPVSPPRQPEVSVRVGRKLRIKSSQLVD